MEKVISCLKHRGASDMLFQVSYIHNSPFLLVVNPTSDINSGLVSA